MTMTTLRVVPKLLLVDFPLEVLTEVFSHCSYLTLKLSVSRTCRLFRDLLKDLSNTLIKGKLAQKLFIDKLTQPITFSHEDDPLPERAFGVHPCLRYLQVRKSSCLEFRFTWNVKDIGFNTPSGFLPILKTPMAAENAISPACDFSFIKVRRHGDVNGRYSFSRARKVDKYIETDGTTGITVGNLVKFLAKELTRANIMLRRNRFVKREAYGGIDQTLLVDYYRIFRRINVRANYIDGTKDVVPDLCFWPSKTSLDEPARLTRVEF